MLPRNVLRCAPLRRYILRARYSVCRRSSKLWPFCSWCERAAETQYVERKERPASVFKVRQRHFSESHFEQLQSQQPFAFQPIFAPARRIRSVSIIQRMQPNVASPDATTGEPNGKRFETTASKIAFHGAQIHAANFRRTNQSTSQL